MTPDIFLRACQRFGLAASLALGLLLISMLLLALPLSLPLGPSYCDLFMYLDAGHRIAAGEIPHCDFFAVMGPLSTYLHAALTALFPTAHPLLAAQYGVTLVAAPALAIATRDTGRGVTLLVWGLFTTQALLPVNFDAFPEPYLNAGAAGNGIYNRQAGLLLYALTALFWLGRPTRSAAAAAALCMAALALIKITGIAGALPILMWAVIARQLLLRPFVITCAALIALIALIDLPTGMIRAYLHDMVDMGRASGAGGILFRLREAAQAHVAMVVALALVFTANALQALRKIKLGAGTLETLRGDPALAIAALSLTGLVVESQNTGAQNFAFILPALVRLGVDALQQARVVPLALAATIGTGALLCAQIAERGARFVKAAISYKAVPALHATPFRVLVQHGDISRAKQLEGYVIESNAGGTPMPDLFNYGAHFIPAWHLMTITEQVDLAARVRAYEQNTGRRFETVVELDFTDPLALILDRRPITGLSTVYDPGRMMFPRLSKRLLAGLAQAEAIFVPHCPKSGYRLDYLTRAAPVLEGRERVEFGPCWTGYLKR
jgi:hypothetical protein